MSSRALALELSRGGTSRTLRRRDSRHLRREDSLRWGDTHRRSGEVVGLEEREPLTRFAHVAAPAAVLYSTIWAFVQIGVVDLLPGTGRETGIAALATAGYLPFYVWHIVWGVRGSRPDHAWWSLAAMSAVVVGATPFIGADWLPTYHVIAVSALLVLRPAWAWPVFAAVVIVQVPLAGALDSPIPAAGSYYAVTALWRTASVFVPVWLVGAVRQLGASRRELAEQAVVQERLRVDGELRRTVGSALAAIVSRGERAAGLTGSRGAAVEVQTLVDDARSALADARRLMSGYQQPSLQSELDTAASLLSAAGVDAHVVMTPGGSLPDTLDDGLRADLRSVVADVLRDERASSCVLEVADRGGRLSIDATTDSGTVIRGERAGR